MKVRVSLFFFLGGCCFASIGVWVFSLWSHSLSILPVAQEKISLLIEELKDPDIMIRRKAISQLGNLEKKASLAIPAILATEVPEVLIRECLQKIGPAPASLLEKILALANSSQAKIKARALRVLGEMDSFPSRGLSLIEQGLFESHEEVLAQSIRLTRIHHITSPKIISRLIELLKEDELWIGEEAAYALIAIGKPVIPFLIESSKKDQELQKSFWRVKVLGCLLEPEKPEVAILKELMVGILEVSPGIKHEIINHLTLFLERSPSSLSEVANLLEEFEWYELLKDSSWRVCDVGIQFLARYEILPLEALVSELKNSHWLIRVGIIRVLGRKGRDAKKTIPALIRTLGIPHHEVFQAASLALNQLGVPLQESVPEIISLLKSHSWRVRAYAAKTLGLVETRVEEIREKLIDALIESLFDAELDVRFRSVEALGKIGAAARKSIPYIEESLNMISNSIVTEEMERVLELLKNSTK